MNRLISIRKFSTSIPDLGQGKRFSMKNMARHTGHFKNDSVDQLFQMSPRENNYTGHIMGHLQPRSNYQGYQHEFWQQRNVKTKHHLPYNSDFTQGELVQEKLIWDYAGTKKAPFTARTKVLKNRVPLLIAPSAETLRNSKFKPYISVTARTENIISANNYSYDESLNDLDETFDLKMDDFDTLKDDEKKRKTK